MIGIQFEFCSEWRCLLGIFFQRGSEMIEDERREFTEISIGLIFFYFRIAKYKKKES
jgi:hypothetical protein